MTTTGPITVKLGEFPLSRGYRYNFTTSAGVRYRAEHDPGDGRAGEKFLVKVLAPAFSRARAGDTTLALVFDQPYKVSAEFLEASIGGLAQKFGVEQVKVRLKPMAVVDHIEVIDRIASGLAVAAFPGPTFVWMG